MLQNARACLLSEMEAQRGRWMSQLSGPALEEASRPIEQHVALQERLLQLGYLPNRAAADGEYGPLTRKAVQAWQRASGLPVTGFIGDADARGADRHGAREPGAGRPGAGRPDPSPACASATTNGAVRIRARSSQAQRAAPAQQGPDRRPAPTGASGAGAAAVPFAPHRPPCRPSTRHASRAASVGAASPPSAACCRLSIALA